MTAPKHDCIADDNIGCPACRVEGAPEISDWRRPDPPAEPTYTASEVKVLTETASKVAYALGRKDAGEEIAAAFEPILYNSPDGDAFEHTHPKWEGEPECPACWVDTIRQVLARVASQAPNATSDATSGVPGHPEVSEAVRSPQEPGEGS